MHPTVDSIRHLSESRAVPGLIASKALVRLAQHVAGHQLRIGLH